MYVYIWDVDETLILLSSLMDGTFARSFTGSKDVRRGIEIGNQLEQALQLSDDSMLFKQIEDLREYDDGRDLTGYELSRDGKNSNRLTALPDSFGELTRLVDLDLHCNRLQLILPASIGSLTRLTNLNLSSNQLTILPDLLGNLTQLKTLIVETNELEQSPIHDWVVFFPGRSAIGFQPAKSTSGFFWGIDEAGGS